MSGSFNPTARTEEFKTVPVKVKEPALSHIEKLYLKAWSLSLSDSKALRTIEPHRKSFPNDNIYSRREAVAYHKNKILLLKTEALSFKEEDILSMLIEEAQRLGPGSSPTARVQALTLLGKHLGLFLDKQESPSKEVTFNIMNYQDSPSSKTLPEEKDSPSPKTLPEEIVKDSPENNIKIKTFQ